jgi:hypothetical protein
MNFINYTYTIFVKSLKELFIRETSLNREQFIVFTCCMVILFTIIINILAILELPIVVTIVALIFIITFTMAVIKRHIDAGCYHLVFPFLTLFLLSFPEGDPKLTTFGFIVYSVGSAFWVYYFIALVSFPTKREEIIDSDKEPVLK